MSKALEVGDNIEVDIGPIAHGGHFIARHNGQVIFVRHGITDEKVIVEITSVSSKLARGDAIKILKPSPDRIKESCEYAIPGGCGGCDFQHIKISAQRELKRIVIKDQLSHIGKVEINPEIISVEPKNGLNWRTRFDFAVSNNGRAGLYSPRTKNVVEIDHCMIATKVINDSGVFERKWKGKDRIRVSSSSADEKNISRAGRNISGPPLLHETVGDYLYEISPESFWQGHKNAPTTLINTAMDLMNLNIGDKVCDLYGGVGLFTMGISERIGENGSVYLVESDDYATKDARKIFKNHKNVLIRKGRVQKELPLVDSVDVILLDPPRNGAGSLVVDQMVSKKPRTIVYVSCDPASLARDTKLLLENNYSLDKIIAIDLFPMTHHIECVAKFKQTTNLPKKSG